MYRKSTFTVVSREREEDELSFFQGNSPKDSQLQFLKEGDSLNEKIDIKMPYLLIREVLDIENDIFIYEEFSESQQLSLKYSYSQFNEKKRKMHSHNFYEIFFVRSGVLSLHIEDEIIEYHEGDCCLCNKNINHITCLDNNFEAYILCIKEDFVCQVARANIYYNNKNEIKSFPAIFDYFINQNKTNPLYGAKIICELKNISGEKDNPSFECIQKIRDEIVQVYSGKSFFLRGLICKFFDILQDKNYYQEIIYEAKLSKEEEVIHKIADAYVDKRKIFTRAEIEVITGYNSDYVERIVKKVTGKTLNEFGRDYMLEHAIKLLDNTSMRISDICAELGYSNRYHFNQLFISKYGISPSEYKKKVMRNL